MATAASDFQREILAGAPGRWLTLWGRAGTGKSMLQKIVYGINLERRIAHYLEWPVFCRRFQQQEDGIANRFARAVDCRVLFLDDIGAEHATAATLAKLYDLLNSRLGKFTFITSNLSPDAWKEREERIGSRLTRGANVHVACNTADFSTRPK